MPCLRHSPRSEPGLPRNRPIMSMIRHLRRLQYLEYCKLTLLPLFWNISKGEAQQAIEQYTNMRKTLTAVLAFLCGVTAYGLDSQDYEWQQNNFWLIIKEDCTLSEALGIWTDKHPEEDINTEYRIQFGEKDNGVALTVDETAELPGVGLIDFAGDCQLIFSGLYTLTANPDSMPNIYVGTPATDGDPAKTQLAITFSDAAIREALAGKDTSDLVEYELVKDCLFTVDIWWVVPPNSVSFQFDTAKQGEYYKYSETQSYKNNGLVNAGATLEKDTAVLYFEGSEAPVGSGFQQGTFTVAFVGSNFEPVVPEPATGTLSLLALAGLSARRRRK